MAKRIPKTTQKPTRAQVKLAREAEKLIARERAVRLREFRSNVAKLKRKGLVLKKTDARKVVPTKHLKAVVRDLGDVLSGAARVFKVGAQKLAAYKKQGYKGARGRVVLKKETGGFVPSRGRDRGLIKEKIQVGEGPTITRTILPLDTSDVESFIRSIRESGQYPTIDGDDYWGFRFFGWNSTKYFKDIDALMDWFERYQSVEKADTPDKQMEVIRNLEIVRIEPTMQSTWSAANQERMKERKRAKRVKRKKKRMSELPEYQQAVVRMQKREYRRKTYDTAKNTLRRRAERERKRNK